MARPCRDQRTKRTGLALPCLGPHHEPLPLMPVSIQRNHRSLVASMEVLQHNPRTCSIDGPLPLIVRAAHYTSSPNIYSYGVRFELTDYEWAAIRPHVAPLGARRALRWGSLKSEHC